MFRQVGLSVVVCGLCGCFSEPEGVAEGSTGTTPGSTTGQPAGSTEESDDDDDGSTTGRGTSPITSGLDGSTSSGGWSTGLLGSTSTSTSDPSPAMLLLDLYGDCGSGEWRSLDSQGAAVTTDCNNPPGVENTVGGGWRFPMYVLPAAGMTREVLVMRPYPSNDGRLSVQFNAGKDGFAPPEGALLEFDYEFINTDGDDGISMLSFAVDLEVGNGTTVSLLNDNGQSAGGKPVGHTGSFSTELDVMGGGDNLVFTVTSQAHASGVGVAIFNGRIRTPG